MTPGTLYLLPNSLGGPVAQILPPQVADAVRQIDGLIAESDRGGRRFLEQFQGLKKPPQQIPIALFNVHHQSPSSLHETLDWFLEPLLRGENWGFVSDAGLPCLADPGAALVARARQKGIPVQVFSGPSAPLLALLASGLPAQQFTFHGYAPKDPEGRKEWIQRCARQPITQLCIEAPYRNQAMLDALIEQLPAESLLGVALDLTLPSEKVRVTTVSQWRRERPVAPGIGPDELNRAPAVFLFLPRGEFQHASIPPQAARSAPKGPADSARRTRRPQGR